MKGGCVILLLALASLSGCVTSTPDTDSDATQPETLRGDKGVDWKLADSVRYNVTLSYGPVQSMSLRIEETDPAGMVTLGAMSGGSTYLVDLDLTTGQKSRIQEQGSSRAAWAINTLAQIPQPGLVFGESIHPAYLMPVGPQWPLLLSSSVGTYGAVAYQVTLNETGWALDARAPCGAPCPLINDEVPTGIWMEFEGDIGQLYPSTATIGLTVGSTIDPQLPVRFERLSVSTNGTIVKSIQPAIESRLFDDPSCMDMVCEDGNEPLHHSILRAMEKIESSADFQAWEDGREEWFPQIIVVSGPSNVAIDGNQLPPDQYLVLMNVVDPATGDNPTFSTREFELVQGFDSPLDVTRQEFDGFGTDPKFFPASPWQGVPFQPLSKYYDRLEADSGLSVQLHDVGLAAQNPVNYQDPAYRVTFLFSPDWDEEGAEFSFVYSAATGQMLSRSPDPFE